ncbi:MAG: hypothetical protein HXS52_03485 [Theionarchaea archaeon]|nr:hypothetical protein [Theionarchaea archaeon]MBU7036969.1 hypothetical protein [Theionarchaea archaeon]
MDRNQFLRPMGLGELLDSSVRLYRKNFLLLVIAQLPLAVFYLLQNAYNYYTGAGGSGLLEIYEIFNDPLGYTAPQQAAPISAFWNFLIVMLFTLFQIGLIYPLTLSAVTKVASDTILEGEASVKNAYRYSLKNWLKLGVTNVIYTIALIVVLAVAVSIPAVVVISIVAYAALSGGAGFMSGLIVGIIVILTGFFIAGIVWVRLSVMYPIMVNEKVFIFEAMSRSWKLVGGHTFRLYAALIIVFLIPTVLQSSSLILEGLFSRSMYMVIMALGLLTQGILIPLADCTRVLAYFDLRTRKEGFDLEMRTQNLSLPAE